mmetsp:Transcript_162396/g.515951  ORF Transcript_162396/g.515951 Transcript_162396/m.515951 type:complete len:214 (-) Transcript_162396:660-1301(-)
MGGKQSAELPKPKAAVPKAAAPTLQDSTARLDTQIANLETKIEKSNNDAKKWMAQASTNPSAKARAMQCLKMKKQYEQHRDQLMNTQFNLENMAFQQEQAEVIATAVAAMAAGRDQMKAQQLTLNVESVEKITDDLQDLQAEMQDIQTALAGSALAAAAGDDAELEAEFAKMQEEAELEKVMSGGSALPALSTAAPAALPATAAPAAPAPMAA